MQVVLARIGVEPAVRLAADELSQYLQRIDPDLSVEIRVYSAFDRTATRVIWVGRCPELDQNLPEVSDPELDDAICIRVEDGAGFITGTNPRAVLISAYRFLRELGCAWIRPGDDGALVPSYPIRALNVAVREKARVRHRAVCIEGACSLQHVRDMIHWLPRAAMNGYFIQFSRPFHFFDRWYRHESNPYLEAQPVTREDVDAITAALTEEISQRDLLFHQVGHGWTCAPLGFPADGWQELPDEAIGEQARRALAEVGGRRGFFGNIPLNTNLCTSSKDVRELVTGTIADWCAAHPAVRFLHFWLADGFNNTCECPACIERPSDYYVQMLNELDEKLSARGLPTRIVFLVYCDLLWPPCSQTLKNPDRFVLMFAPISRDYNRSYADMDPAAETCGIPPYRRNRNEQPKELGTCLAFLRAWQKLGAKDSFLFDYHLMWDHLKDPGYEDSALLLYRDMNSLDRLDLNGMVSCQLTRCSFPTGLPMRAMAEALWDGTKPYEDVRRRYYQEAFGSSWETAAGYLSRMTELLDPRYTRMEPPAPYPEAERLARVREAGAAAAAFGPEAQLLAKTESDSTRRRSWEILALHAKYIVALASCTETRILEGPAAAEGKISALTDFLMQNEVTFQSVYDPDQVCARICEIVSAWAPDKDLSQEGET